MRKFILAVLSCLLLCGCGEVEQTASIFAMDTIMNIRAYSKDESVIAKAEKEINRLDALLDRSDERSEIYKMNEKKTASVSQETAQLIETALKISRETNGAFDITTAPLSDIWGFYTKNYRVPDEAELENAMQSVGFDKVSLDANTVTVSQNTSLDLGAIAKGYTSDRVKDILIQNGVTSAIVSLGGNVYAIGERPDGSDWSVGIADPADKDSLIATLDVRDTSVVTSGGYQRCFTQDGVTYHHIIDPKTGKSAQSGLSSVTVITENGTVADAYSTALFVMGLNDGIRFWRENKSFEAVFVTDEGAVYITPGLDGAYISERNYTLIDN